MNAVIFEGQPYPDQKAAYLDAAAKFCLKNSIVRCHASLAAVSS